MKTITTLCLATVLSLLSLNSSATNSTTPFTTPASSTPVASPARIVNFSGSISNEKVLLTWTAEAGLEASQFEIEKSIDGNDFVMIALVFSTENKSSDNYMFYEKAKNAATSYRVKIILTNGTIAYSPVINVTSATN